jgi:hypothetical protein
MQFIQRILTRLRSPAAQLRRVRAASAYIMRHVGMTGRVDCLGTRDADGRPGFILMVQTPQCIPGAAREEIRQFFRRKLTELGELRGQPFMLLIRDAEDLSLAHRAPANSSSARIASVVAAANDEVERGLPAEQLADLRSVVRQRLSERRRERGDSDYAPLRPVPLTALGSLPEH